jgi:hypothetical protein
MTMTRRGYIVAIVAGAALGAVGCGGDDAMTTTPAAGTTTGGHANTFDHDNDAISVLDLIDRLAREGPSRFTSHLHSCAKLRYATLGNVLAALGVDLTSTAPASAGALYAAAATAYGAPSYANRIREAIAITTSSASAELAIFAAAADEVTAALPTLARCRDGGGPGPAVFDAANNCNRDAITCMIGAPAQAEHVAVCNRTVANASDPAIGRRLAVAAVLGAAYTCE